MNTDKVLDSKFIGRNEHPIWYYKELTPVSVDFVIMYLLKYEFVVEINGCKHEIIFGKNKKHEIGSCIRYDDIAKIHLSSYSVIEKGFKEGKWFIISGIDTTDEFKDDYNKRKEEYEREDTKQWYKKILSNIINDREDLSEEKRNRFLKEIEYSTYEQLEKLVKSVFEKFKE